MLQKWHPPAGARPGTLAIPEGAPPPRIRLVTYDPETIDEQEIDDLADLVTVPTTEVCSWVDVRGLGDEDVLRRLADIFSIHPLALEDLVNVPVRPKAELYDDHMLLIVRGALRSEAGIRFEQFGMVIGSRWLLTIQEDPSDTFEPILHRLRVGRGRPMRRSGTDYLAYAMFDYVIDGYFPIAEALHEELVELEEEVLLRPQPWHLESLNRLRRELFVLRRSITPQRDATSALIRGEDDFVSDTVRVYLRDVLDHCLQIGESIDAAREMVANQVNLYLSVLGQRTNEVMRVLTIVTSIFVPLTFLAGIYGMNFEHIPELRWSWGYPVLLGVMVVMAAALLLLFRRKGWLGGVSS